MVRLTKPFPGTPELFKLAANVERSCSRLGIQWSDPDAPGRFHDAFKNGSSELTYYMYSESRLGALTCENNWQ